MESIIRDISLAESGQRKIDWVKGHMPLLNYFNEKYAPTQLFKGINMVVTIHLEAKTAYLALTLKNCGANVTVTGSNPLSTQDDVAAALVANGIAVFATHACTNEEYDMYLDKALDTQPVGRQRRNHHRRDPSAGAGGSRKTCVSYDRGQRQQLQIFI